jgi:hypothetical protein
MATVEHTDTVVHETGEAGAPAVRRRDFINIAAVSFAGVGGVVSLFPLINQMNPSKDVLALASIEVDVSQIQPGQAIKTIWRKQPIFIRNLTPPEIRPPMPCRWASCAIRRRLRSARWREAELAHHHGRLHPSWMRAARRCGRGEQGRVSGLFLSLPRLPLRHGGPHPKRARRRPISKCRNIPFLSDTVVKIG